MSESDNKAVVPRFYDELLNQRRADVLDEIAAEDYLEHDPFPGQGNGRADLNARVGMYAAMTIDSNKAIIRRFMEDVLNGRDVDVLDEILAEDYLDHAAFPRQEPGRRGVKWRISYLLAALDPRWTAHDFIAEGDLVVARWSLTGTHRGEFLGLQATGKEFTLKVIEVYRVRDGKMAEHWNVVDMFGLYQQLGLIPREPLQPDGDSTDLG